MTRRSRVTAFALLVGVCVVGIALAVLMALGAGRDEVDASRDARVALIRSETAGSDVVVFRSLKTNRPAGEGQLAVSEAARTASRTLQSLRCDRSHFAAGRGICVTRGKGFAEGYQVALFDREFHIRKKIPVEGIPSRARVSPDGRYGAVTMFVTGHSYAAPGTFSTQTILLDLASGKAITDLEQFRVWQGERLVTAIDVNFWGVTFSPADSNRFYATLATGGETYLIEGSIRDRRATVLHTNVECPSLSPDGTRITYKRRTDSDDRPWRLTVLDLATMRETPLAETRSVDDQAEWLDNDRVLYGLEGAVWVVRADGTGKPRRFLADADSPAVVRY